MDFDFIQVSIVDIHGQYRTKTVPRSRFLSAQENGIPFFCGAQTVSLRSELHVLEEMKKQNCGNGFAMPDLSTLYKKPWLSKEFKIGHVLADMYWPDMETHELVPHEACSRVLAKKAVEALKEAGYSLYSAFEYEFQILDAATEKSVILRNDVFVDISLPSKCRQFMYRACHELQESGIQMEYFNREHATSQLEIPLLPTFGINGADKASLFKTTMKELAQDVGYIVTFMSRPFVNDSSANGAHFNFSLWDFEGKKNVLYDPHGEYKLSKVGRHWLGGIMTHLPSLVAICAPTFNCYRRLNKGWTPSKFYWGVDDRLASIRVKNNSQEYCYFENRLCSASTNPYAVIASIIYAGLDGIQNELEPPKAGESLHELPHSLKEALDVLKTDSYMMEKLGKYAEWFITVKEMFEVETFQHHDLTRFDEDELKKEREEYLLCC